MRIDSFNTQGTNLVMYQFHSLRGSWFPPGTAQLDSNGGSWLGKRISQTANGDCYFETLWGDTVLIKARANIGDSWTFYDDSSSNYYIATFTNADTATVLGSVDSVKTLNILAYNGSGVNTADLAHNKTIILSRDHGFVSVFSLYTFPFHPPAIASYQQFQDYLMDKRDIVSGQIRSYQLISYTHPTKHDVFDFSVGDVFEFHGSQGPNQYWRLDSVASKLINPDGSVSYDLAWSRRTHVVNSGPAFYSYTSGYRVITANNDFLIPDTSRMPEEKDNPFSYVYLPFDSSYCLDGVVYRYSGLYTELSDEPCGGGDSYKTGLGRIGMFLCLDPSPTNTDNLEEQMIYWRKNGIVCGTPTSVGVHESATRINLFSIFPNPAHTKVWFDVGSHKGVVTVFTYTGTVIYQSTNVSGSWSLAVDTWAPGTYFLEFRTNSGRFYRKLLVY